MEPGDTPSLAELAAAATSRRRSAGDGRVARSWRETWSLSNLLTILTLIGTLLFSALNFWRTHEISELTSKVMTAGELQDMRRRLDEIEKRPNTEVLDARILEIKGSLDKLEVRMLSLDTYIRAQGPARSSDRSGRE